MARVVVTGGAGFVGAAVLDALAERGDDVVVVDSLRPDVHRDGGTAARGRLDGRRIPVRHIDVRDRDRLVPVVRGSDAVVHLAAKVGLGVDLSDIDDYVSSNDLGTAVVLRAAADAGVRAVVQAGSMVVYGEGRYTCPRHGVVPPGPRRPGDLEAGRFEPPCPRCGDPLEPGLVDEDAPLDPRNTYAATKVAQEHLAAVWARETGGRAVSLRLHNVYGPGMPRDTPYAGVAAIFLSALARGEAPRVHEDGRQRRDFVHVADVGRAFARAVGRALEPDAATTLAPHTALNVGSGVVGTVGGLARTLAEAVGGPEPVVTGAFRLGDVRHVTASSERAATTLGWRAGIPLAEGVRDLVAEASAREG
ncbi:NAD-dependent epimerase/dehydratase family protein [Lapillicoccus jejuensis]|uniref:dTDP-L-rhamnose 4-epimerase n=1 Tax=Lapillicoccus jejuensis TaxID=402171 RepID=A0A542E2F2_9MICO|nr:NAD-dependent epimerase/dehydratase family protein [Lapillicoccus jejuensis]TQJ09495.1 dTDP-L-rhamnose 4-epimerase [Lapillicoccus jejuensis]